MKSVCTAISLEDLNECFIMSKKEIFNSNVISKRKTNHLLQKYNSLLVHCFTKGLDNSLFHKSLFIINNPNNHFYRNDNTESIEKSYNVYAPWLIRKEMYFENEFGLNKLDSLSIKYIIAFYDLMYLANHYKYKLEIYKSPIFHRCQSSALPRLNNYNNLFVGTQSLHHPIRGN